ncbi:MAG: trypsin-like serine peptidase [Paracoccaceae bacterium]
MTKARAVMTRFGRVVAGSVCALALMMTMTLANLSPLRADGTPLKRLTLREDQLGWEAVGRLDTGMGYCTGTLIAADVVLTAAHCLFSHGGDKPVDVAGMTFRAGLVDGRSVAERGVRFAVAHPVYDPHQATGPESIRHDVALVLLDKPISISHATPFKLGDAPDSIDVSVVSYAQGRNEALSWQERCTVLGRYKGLFAFDCDVDFGSSGAPVFARTEPGKRPRIVSIISAGNRAKDEAVAYGMELTSLLPALQDAARDAQMQHGAAIAAAAPAPDERRAVRVGDEGAVKSTLLGGGARTGGGGAARFQRVTVPESGGGDGAAALSDASLSQE